MTLVEYLYWLAVRTEGVSFACGERLVEGWVFVGVVTFDGWRFCGSC